MKEGITVPTYQHGLWVNAQGLELEPQVVKTYIDGSMAIVSDKLRLYGTTNAAVIPTRSVIRILATAEDVTHSWAI